MFLYRYKIINYKGERKAICISAIRNISSGTYACISRFRRERMRQIRGKATSIVGVVCVENPMNPEAYPQVRPSGTYA